MRLQGNSIVKYQNVGNPMDRKVPSLNTPNSNIQKLRTHPKKNMKNRRKRKKMYEIKELGKKLLGRFV
jgi:hypothetical protein